MIKHHMDNIFYITVLQALVVLFVCHFVIKKLINDRRLIPATPASYSSALVVDEDETDMKDELQRYANTIALTEDALPLGEDDSSSDDDDVSTSRVPNGALPGSQFYSKWDAEPGAQNPAAEPQAKTTAATSDKISDSNFMWPAYESDDMFSSNRFSENLQF